MPTETQKKRKAEKLENNLGNLEILRTDSRFGVAEKSQFHYHICHLDSGTIINYWPSSDKFMLQNEKGNVKVSDFNSMINWILEKVDG